MLCREVRATTMVAIMLADGVSHANDMPIEEACRLYSRLQRRRWAAPYGVALAELDRRGRQRRRARHTKPGKRGRR